MTNASARSGHEFTNGSSAISGVTAIRPTVIALGRFIAVRKVLCERLEDQLRDCLQCIEDTIPGDSDRLEISRPLDPLAGRELLDEVLAGVVGVGGEALLARV